MSEAWAVRESGVILSDTVHSSRRGAIVNWLVTQRGKIIFVWHDDSDIECFWKDALSGDGLGSAYAIDAQAIRVRILPELEP